jgi:hypothetical protein
MNSYLTAAVFVVLIAFMLWFALGTQRNIRKGNDVLRWLQDGLPLLGRRTTMRWLGSTAVELKIADAEDPFAAAEVVVALEARDLGWLQALGRTRGRRDLLILRGRLRRAPGFEVEAGDTRAWTGRDGLARLDTEAWARTSWDLPGVEVAHGPDADISGVRRLWDAFRAAGAPPWRLGVRREPPHVQVHVALPDTSATRSRELVRLFADLARVALARRG